MAFTYTLSSEGSSDQMLVPVIEWVLAQHSGQEFAGRWANPSVFENKEKDVETRMRESIRLYPSDILFVHRDTDAQTFSARCDEIHRAAELIGVRDSTVAIVPVKMTEAWFLFDENAIRLAAGNPTGRTALGIPNQMTIQRRANPKTILEQAILAASDERGRKREDIRRRFPEKKNIVSQRIDDFSPLRQHESFRLFEGRVEVVLRNLNLV